MIDFDTRYALMASEQVPPRVIAQWLQEPLFARWLERKRSTQG